ncbi:MAG: hypothetical protein WCO68_03350 [Verrucomicrobiota bacterium]
MADKQLQVVPPQEQSIRTVEDRTSSSYLFDPARFQQMWAVAKAMAQGTLIPEHLWKDKQGNFDEAQVEGNCFLIVNQAVNWNFDPFAVAQASYFVRGKLGYEGKLVNAVINAKAGLKNRLAYTFSGSGQDLTITVSGTFENETDPRTITLSVKDAKTDNDMWRKDPEQKLVYAGGTKWARRHCPEVIFGVLTDDDVDKIAGDQPRNMDDPHERALSQYEIDRKATEEYNARLIAAGEPAEMLEPMPTPPDDDELPGLKTATPEPLPWREIEVVHFTTLKGKKLGELPVTMLEKIKATIEKMGPGQRAGKFGLDAILAGVIDGLKELASKPEDEPAKTEASSPQSKATPLQQLENLIKGCRIKESELLAYVTKVEKVEYLGLAQLPERIILGMIKNWEGCMEAILNDSGAQ